EAAKSTIKGVGGTILGEEYQPLQQSDWTAIISKIRAANPDGIIYSTSGGGPNIDFMKQFKAAGLKMPVGSLSIDELTAEAGGDAAEGVYYTGDYFTGLDNPENRKFLDAMRKKFGAGLAVGAYAGVVTTGLGWNPWTALLVAFVIGVAGAALVEWRVLRGLYARPMDTILATWGLNIIVVQLITLYFGREIRFAESAIGRAVTVSGATYSEYRLVLLLLALALGVAVWLVMQRTQIGIVARAVIMNEELAQ